jgi:hypothetical protein
MRTKLGARRVRLSILSIYLVRVRDRCAGDPDGANGAINNAVAVLERGIDYAWSRPSSSQALRAAGYTFVARYLSYDTTGKNLSPGEAQQLFAAGIDVVANWEWGADDALQGFATARTRSGAGARRRNAMPGDRRSTSASTSRSPGMVRSMRITSTVPRPCSASIASARTSTT